MTHRQRLSTFVTVVCTLSSAACRAPVSPEQHAQVKTVQDVLAIAADKLAANPVPGIMAGFTDGHRHLAPPHRKEPAIAT